MRRQQPDAQQRRQDACHQRRNRLHQRRRADLQRHAAGYLLTAGSFSLPPPFAATPSSAEPQPSSTRSTWPTAPTAQFTQENSATGLTDYLEQRRLRRQDATLQLNVTAPTSGTDYIIVANANAGRRERQCPGALGHGGYTDIFGNFSGSGGTVAVTENQGSATAIPSSTGRSTPA